MKELYRAVVQKRPILAMLEPDVTQDGGLDEPVIRAMLGSEDLDGVKFSWLQGKWKEWRDEGALAPGAFDHAPSGREVAAALFTVAPVEWNRLPHFQDVTIRLIAERGILHGTGGSLYLQGEMASVKVPIAPSVHRFHLYCSPHNIGAKGLAHELQASDILGKTQGLAWTDDETLRTECDRMLVLLDSRTWTSGVTTANLVKEIDEMMAIGIPFVCVHEFPSVVGPARNACNFEKMFRSDWTPDHLQSGATNLYKEIALALKGEEWRKPGLVALASKINSPLDAREPRRATSHSCPPRRHPTQSFCPSDHRQSHLGSRQVRHTMRKLGRWSLRRELTSDRSEMAHGLRLGGMLGEEVHAQ